MIARIHEYWETHDGVVSTRANILDFERKITRYQAYRRDIDGEADFTLFVERLTLEDMNDFRDYLANEHLLREEHPQFYAQFGRSRYRHKAISNTTLVNTMICTACSCTGARRCGTRTANSTGSTAASRQSMATHSI